MIFMSICRISARIATWQIFEWRVFPTTHVGRWRQLHDTTCLQNQENFQKAELCGPRFACFCFLLISFFYISISSLDVLFFQSCNLYHIIAQNYRKRVLRNVWAQDFLQRLWFVFSFSISCFFLGFGSHTPPPPQKTHLFSFKHEFVFSCFSALFNVPCSCSQKNQQIKVTRDKVWRTIFVVLL